jgi:hypothetical protein
MGLKQWLWITLSHKVEDQDFGICFWFWLRVGMGIKGFGS